MRERRKPEAGRAIGAGRRNRLHGHLLLAGAVLLSAMFVSAPAYAQSEQGQSNFYQQNAGQLENQLQGGGAAPCHQTSKPVIMAYLDGAASLNPPSTVCEVVTAMGACQHNMGVSQDRNQAYCCLRADPDDPACQSVSDGGKPAKECSTCTGYPWMETLGQTPMWTSCLRAVEKLPAHFSCPPPGSSGAGSSSEGEIIGDVVSAVIEILF